MPCEVDPSLKIKKNKLENMKIDCLLSCIGWCLLEWWWFWGFGARFVGGGAVFHLFDVFWFGVFSFAIWSLFWRLRRVFCGGCFLLSGTFFTGLYLVFACFRAAFAWGFGEFGIWLAGVVSWCFRIVCLWNEGFCCLVFLLILPFSSFLFVLFYKNILIKEWY